MSLLQGFSLGLPAIVTDVGGMAEVVRLADAGLTVSPTDPADMAAAILRVAGDEADRKRFSTNGHAAFHRWFDLSTVVAFYMDLYRRGGSSAKHATEQPVDPPTGE